MMNLRIVIPATPLDVFKSGLVRASEFSWYKGAVLRLRKHYGAIFDEIAVLHNVPAAVLCTLVSIENPDASEASLRAKMERIVTGNPRSGACGLCQINCKTADVALYTEATSGNLSEDEVAYFRNHLGARYDTIVSGKAGFGSWSNGAERLVHTLTDLRNPAYNLHIGALRFGQLMREATEPGGLVRLDRAIVRYNGSAAPMPPVGSSVAAVLASQKGKNRGRDHNTTYKWILKAIGTNGGMDLLTRSA